MNSRKDQLAAVDRLLTIMDELREQCPWDRKQTFESLRHLTIEETYELGDAILERDLDEIKNELGDLLLHIAFYAKLGSEEKAFDMADIAHSISEKLIHRHPHIYGDVKVENEEEVKQNWEVLKLKEGKRRLGGVPKGLPPWSSPTYTRQGCGVGFDWEQPEQVWEKVQEELAEFQAEVEKAVQPIVKPSLATCFFDDQYARFLKINPDTALERTNQKFTQRFNYLEAKAQALGKSLHDMTLAEMDVYWEEAKRQ